MTLTGIAPQSIEDLSQIAKGSGKALLVDFWATWCGPCKALSPVLDAIEQKGMLNVLKLDVEYCPELMNQVGISSVPCLVIFNDRGEFVGRRDGAGSQSVLEGWIKGALS